MIFTDYDNVLIKYCFIPPTLLVQFADARACLLHMVRTVPAQCYKPSCYMHFAKTKGEEEEVLSIKIVKQLNQLTGYSHEHMPKRVL